MVLYDRLSMFQPFCSYISGIRNVNDENQSFNKINVNEVKSESVSIAKINNISGKLFKSLRKRFTNKYRGIIISIILFRLQRTRDILIVQL